MNHNQSIEGVFLLLTPLMSSWNQTKKLLENSWTCSSLFILWCLYNNFLFFTILMYLSWNGQVSLVSLVPPPPNASPKAHQRHYYLATIGMWAMTACLSSYHVQKNVNTQVMSCSLVWQRMVAFYRFMPHVVTMVHIILWKKTWKTTLCCLIFMNKRALRG